MHQRGADGEVERVLGVGVCRAGAHQQGDADEADRLRALHGFQMASLTSVGSIRVVVSRRRCAISWRRMSRSLLPSRGCRRGDFVEGLAAEYGEIGGFAREAGGEAVLAVDQRHFAEDAAGQDVGDDLFRPWRRP